MLTLLAAGGLLLVAPSAAAGCLGPVLCTWDTNGDGWTDTLYAGAGSSTATATKNGNSHSANAGTYGTAASADLWWSDEDLDMDPERAFANAEVQTGVAGRSTGGYATAYVEDYDQGDVVDYATATAQAGVDRYGAGVSTSYRDAKEDLRTALPFSTASASW